MKIAQHQCKIFFYNVFNLIFWKKKWWQKVTSTRRGRFLWCNNISKLQKHSALCMTRLWLYFTPPALYLMQILYSERLPSNIHIYTVTIFWYLVQNNLDLMDYLCQGLWRTLQMNSPLYIISHTYLIRFKSGERGGFGITLALTS